MTEETFIVLLDQWWADGGAGEAPLRRHLYRQLQPLPQTDGCQEVPELGLSGEEKVHVHHTITELASLNFKSAVTPIRITQHVYQAPIKKNKMYLAYVLIFEKEIAHTQI